MVTRTSQKFAGRPKTESGSLVTELVVAMAVLVLAIIPLAFTYPQEEKLLRSSYQRAVAMEIVDGEMEILLAGEWRSFKEGAQPYTFRAQSATNLPPGRAELTVAGKHLRLDWQPAKKASGGEVVREADVK
ncbi:MAG TPA: hypothetical protein VG754_08145 [Verrucomicrobiae bacterium]|jgi:hypothetical protein|nr:hypothetical protein [Verrucomicrobiae bacterium]